MLWQMARGKLREERAVMTTLAGLILLSVLLACAGTGLITRLVGSGDSLLARADAPHLAQLTSGHVDAGAIDAFSGERPEVTAHQVMPMLGIPGSQLLFDGEDQSGSVQENALVVPSTARDLLLDLEDRPLTDVAPGTIWLPLLYQDSGLAVGSSVTVTAPDGFRRELTVAGFLRDSTMGPAIAGSKRLAVSDEDLAEIAQHAGTWESLIGFWVEDPARDLSALRSAYQQAGLPASGPSVDRSGFMLFTVFADGLVAAIVLLAAAMVLAVAMLTLRLALRTVLARDRREIAVMSAIGISARDVRRLHLLVHGSIAAGAAAAGLVGGLLLERALSAGLTRFLGETGGTWPVLLPALVASAVVLAVLAMVAAQLRRLRRVPPLDVLRGTDSGGAAERPGPVPLHRLPLPVGPSLGLLSMLRRGGSAPLLITVFAVCALLVMVPSSISTTMASPQFSSYFGLGAAKVRLDLAHTDEDSAEEFETARRALEQHPQVEASTALVTTRHLVSTVEGEQLELAVSHGDRTATPSTYAEGRAPRGEGEIALSLLSLAESGLEVGDELPIQLAGDWSTLEIVGSYQDLTNGGRGAQAMLPTEGEHISGYVLGAVLTPGTDVTSLTQDLSAQLPYAEISDAEQFRTQLLGSVGERIQVVAVLAALTAMALAALLAAMVTRLWLATDRTALAVQHALGASALTLHAPYLTRMLLCLLLGIAAGGALSLTAGQGLFNVLIEGMFGGMEHLFQGTSRLDLVTDPWLTGIVLPVLLGAVAALTTLWTARRLRTSDVRTLTAD